MSRYSVPRIHKPKVKVEETFATPQRPMSPELQEKLAMGIQQLNVQKLCNYMLIGGRWVDSRKSGRLAANSKK
jgi:hypothetical protein